MINRLLFIICALTIVGCHGQVQKSDEKSFPIEKSEQQWREQLTPEQYEILREKGTERAFSGEYVDNFKKGKYVCVACNNLLFTSDAKFTSDCGWPSFDQAVKGAVVYKQDNSFGMSRTEVMCSQCGGHLGHVFNDGPRETTGQRYCTNSVSIKFIPEK